MYKSSVYFKYPFTREIIKFERKFKYEFLAIIIAKLIAIIYDIMTPKNFHFSEDEVVENEVGIYWKVEKEKL